MHIFSRDLLITGSMDETVKVWDLKDGTPSFVSQKNMAIGQVYVLGSCPDVPYVFCGGGSKKDSHLYVWDSRENEQGKKIFEINCKKHGKRFYFFFKKSDGAIQRSAI